MNLLDYVSKSHVKTATVEYNGEKLDFFYRDITAAESELITEKVSGVLAFVEKQKKDAEKMPDGEEIKSMNDVRDLTLFYQICDQAGDKLFKSIEEMKAKIPVKLLDAAQKAIQKSITTEQAEKN
ncbi:MAG: hypothetical protein OQK29_01490 [Ignavibacteriaceae bacterium]|nr:hypothetical protein [Ignavibacteriaceae bacterium]